MFSFSHFSAHSDEKTELSAKGLSEGKILRKSPDSLRGIGAIVARSGIEPLTFHFSGGRSTD